MSSKSDVIVEFVDVEKTYDGEALAVRNLNLQIRRGEFLTLLGPSGSGKTTTLLMLAGFEAPTEGDILLEGESITKVPPHKRNFGMVFQDYALFPHMTVWENLAFPLTARKVRKAEIQRKIARALEMVHLVGYETRRPSQLSGGQQQRVALARALVFEPELVLMDEPLGALDKQLRERMQLEIRHIHENLGVTVLYVTHDQAEALTMSDRIAVFNEGGIQQLARPDKLYEEPENSFVAQFIGENNRLPGKVVEFDRSMCKVEIDGGATVEAIAVDVGAVGSRTLLSLRPESVVLDPPDGACPNHFEARVEELIYLGDHTRARIRVCGNDEFVIKLPRMAGTPRLEVGQAIKVGWRSEDCRALAAS